MNKLIILIPLMILISCGTKTTKEKQTTPEPESNSIHFTESQVKNAGIISGYPERKSVSSVLKVNGRIDVPPQNMVSISVPLGGYLKNSHLLPGMHVKKGEAIATIEDQQYIQIQQDYLTAISKLKYSEADYNRQKALNESKASSDKLFQQTEADYKTWLIMVKSLSEKLKLIGINPESLNENTLSRSVRITAPIDGFVSQVNVNIGKYVNPSDVLFELVNPSDIHLALRVFEKDLDKIDIGQRVDAYSNSHPDKKYKCEIILISQNFSDDRSVEVHCHFKDYDRSLIPGMYMNADIQTKMDDGIVVPETAIVAYEGRSYIFVDKGDGNYQMSEVTAEGVNAGYAKLSALKDTTQKIVLKGAYSLLMAMKNKAE